MSLKVLSWLLFAAVGSLLVFVCVAGYTRKETVAGYLAPAMGTAEIFVPQPGTVTDVHVAEDQLVDQGDILLTIDTAQIAADGTRCERSRSKKSNRPETTPHQPSRC